MHINSKLIGWVAVILIIAFAGYTLFTSSSSQPATTTDQNGNPVSSTSQTVGADLLALLDQLKSVNFSTGLFSNQTFLNLIDFDVPLPTPSLGRPNPFNTIGVDTGVLPNLNAPQTPQPIQTSTSTTAVNNVSSGQTASNSGAANSITTGTTTGQ